MSLGGMELKCDVSDSSETNLKSQRLDSPDCDWSPGLLAPPRTRPAPLLRAAASWIQGREERKQERERKKREREREWKSEGKGGRGREKPSERYKSSKLRTT